MNRYLLLFLFLIVSYNCSYGQYENVWAFGSAGYGLDFNTNGKPIPFPSGISSAHYIEGCASVCDRNGRLLFYMTGDTIWDRSHRVMFNGGGLTGRPLSQEGFSACASSTQGALIVPAIGDRHRYYVFSLSDMSTKMLYYSVVDMRLNGGYGGVENEHKGIPLDSGLTEKMTSIAGDHCNVWVIVQHDSTKNYHTWEITEKGISSIPVVSFVDESNKHLISETGGLYASPDRKRLVSCKQAPLGGAELLDFDYLTGKLSNSVLLAGSRYPQPYGAAFSPDNSKLYITGGSNIYQYDLTAPDIGATIVKIGPSGMVIKLGPDGKIWNLSMTVIERPNSPGLSCSYVPSNVTLIARDSNRDGHNYTGLPNVVSVLSYDTFYTTATLKAPCFSDITCSASNVANGWDYIWNDGLIGDSRTLNRPGTFWVSYRSPPCNYHVDTFHVGFPAGVLPDLHVLSSCAGNLNGKAWATTYPQDTLTYHYTWMNSSGDTLSFRDSLTGVSSGNYQLRIRTEECDTILNVFVPEESYKVSFTSDSIVCQGSPVTFNNTSDEHFTKYTWEISNGVSAASEDLIYPFNTPGTYQIQLSGIGAVCSDSIKRTIIVDSIYSGVFVSYPKKICLGESIVYYPENISTASSLDWSFGDSGVMTQLPEQKIHHAYANAGIMYVTLTSHFRACPSTRFTDTVVVYALPEVNLGSDGNLCLNGIPIFLKSRTAIKSDPIRYLWNTGDTTAYLKVTHSGTYSLTVASGPLGCSSAESVEVKKDCYLDIPNVFTPNGDGYNDFFFPRQLVSKGISKFKMQVLSRWGQIVFETININGRGWDGKFMDIEQPQGSYIYKIEAEINGKLEIIQGNVTLLR